MGSRKKKVFNHKQDSKQLTMLRHYSDLSINEKINYRTYFYWLGRQRLNFIDILSTNCPRFISIEDMRFVGELGIFHFLRKPIV